MVAYPKDWAYIPLNYVLKEHFWLMPATPSYVSSGVHYITSKNIINGKISFEKTSKISYKDFSKISSIRKIEKNDILISMIGTVGNIGIVQTNKKFYGQNIYLIRPDKKRLDSNFFYYLFNLSSNKNNTLNSRGGSSQRYLKAESIINMMSYIPPLEEQQAIANTLSTFDEHIENLTKLIEKKKAIRDGALEDLMSGRTRLDGFNGNWRKIKFSDYFKKMSNNTFSRDMLSKKGEIGNIHYGDVLIKFGAVLHDEHIIPRIKNEVLVENPTYLKENDVIFADTAEDESVGKAVQIGRVSVPLVSGLHTIACRPLLCTAPGFLGYYANSKVFHNQLLSLITGIKVSSISRKAIDTTDLYIPVDVNEQQAIASVLTAMDEEINSLEQEKNKIIQLKDGAMDDLLTGKVRLV